MENYTFERMKKDLNDGFVLNFDYNNNRYRLFKVNDNCYSQELMTIKEKSPHAVKSLISHKALKEMYPFMSNIEYEP
ncbi:MAG: hypothetical protein IKP28_05785 [Clostridia bacterium]|nr:hypothetical protein [Clostridia bacterium]